MVKNKAYFIDLDILIEVNNSAWVVDRTNPNVPIKKISKSDFNLIRNGIFKSQGNRLDFNGKEYWLPKTLYEELKVKCKANRIDIANLAISMQEFLNKDIIDGLDYTINKKVIELLKNKTDDIYIISSRLTKSKYEGILENLKKLLTNNGIHIKNMYYISDNFYNQEQNNTKFKKIRILLQHLIGRKTEGDKFIDIDLDTYRKIEYMDDEIDTLNIARQINSTLEVFLSRTDNGLRDVIKEDIIEFKPTLIITKINDNELNTFTRDKVILNLSKVKTFESFNNGFK